MLRFCLIAAFSAAVSAPGAPLISNGSFEQGTGGYWINRPAAVRVDTTDSTDGMQCVAIDPLTKGVTSVVQGIRIEPDQVYVITFDARSTVADNPPQLTISGMLQGDKPLAFFEPPADQKKALDTPAAVTDQWKSFTQKIGPVPVEVQGKPVKKIMLYWNVKPGAPGAKLLLDNIRITTESAPQTAPKAAPKAAASGPNLLNNGSFEQGMAGFWTNRAKAIQVETSGANAGKQCISIEAPTQGAVNLAGGVKFQPGQVYTVTFDARSTAPEGGPRLTLGAMMRGDQPIAFFDGVGEQKKQLKTPVAVTGEWKTFTQQIGPIPAEAMGKTVKNLMMYWDVKPGTVPGKLFLDNLQVTAAPATGMEGETAGAIRFTLPAPVRIYESVPAFSVESDVGDGFLRVTGSDAFGRELFVTEGKPGQSKLPVTLPGPDYYAIRAEVIADGKAVKSGETSVMVTTPLPEDYYDTPHPAFGVWGGLTPELRRLAGAKWDRQLFFTFFQKPDAEATPPTPEKVAAREPVKIIRCMNVMHPFKKMVPYSPDELNKVQREKLTKEIVSSRGMVDVWETQNEPMVGENFHGTMNDVMDIIKMESEVVRKNDPGRPIAGICINPMNANQYNQYVGYYRNYGIDNYIDALMLHPYIPGAQSPDASGYVDVLNRLDRDISAIAGRRVPMYISEIGYSTKPGGEVTELQQAAYLARVVLLNRQVPGLAACVWHIGLWNEATSRRELDFGLLRGHPKGSALREPKPGFAAWATVSRMVYDAEFVRELSIGRQVRVLLFNKRGKVLLAAYSLTPENARLQLPLNQTEAVVTEVCGKRTVMPLQDGILTLTLTEAPVYIEGGDFAAFDTDKFTAKFEPETPSGCAGTPITVKVTLPDELAKGDVKLRVPNGEFGTPSVTGSGREWEVSLTPPAELTPGRYDLFFRLESGGRSRYIWQKGLDILPPVELSQLRAAEVDGNPAVAFHVTCNDSRNPNAVLELLDDGGRVLAIGKVRANEDASLPLFLTKSGRKTQLRARFTLPDGRSWTTVLPDGLVPVSIPFFENALEKPLESWPAAGCYAIADGAPSRHAVRGEFDRPEGTLRLAYDKEYLYFAIDEKDAVFKTAPGSSLWDADSLQIAVSVPQKFMIRPNNDGIQETAYAEFGIKADGATPDSWVWASMNLNEMALNAPIPNLISKNHRQGNDTLYRFAVPWKSLNIKPEKAMPLGISILFNDRDDAKDRHWVEWYAGIADGKDPSRYGSAVLR